MSSVVLIDYTGRGSRNPQWYAANVLIFTKNTRLSLESAEFYKLEADNDTSKKISVLKEMAKTIPSSWEFVDMTFSLMDITRACAQQITRTRNASYAMQSQRIVDMHDAEVTNPFGDGEETLSTVFSCAAQASLEAYSRMMVLGAAPQDARGILPMNTQCNLLAKYNLRAFVDLVRSRSSLRTQGEYAEVVRKMVAEIKDRWPWIEYFLEDPKDVAIKDLETIAQELGVEPGSGHGWRIAKAIDLIRKS